MRGSKAGNTKAKELFENCKLFFEVGAKFSLATGFAFVSAYLYFKVNMFPSGVTLSDSFLFIYVLFGCGLICAVMLLVGITIAFAVLTTYDFILTLIVKFITFAIWILCRWHKAAIPYLYTRRWLESWRAKGHWFLGLSVCTAFLVGAFTLTHSRPTGSNASASVFVEWLNFTGSVYFVGVVSFTMAGAAILLYIKSFDSKLDGNGSVEPEKKKLRKMTDEEKRKAIVGKRWNFWRYAFPLMAPIILGHSFFIQCLIPSTMEMLGIRKMNATIVLSEENFRLLDSGMRAQNMIGIGCPLASDPSQRIVYGANIIWTGIGERSLIEIPASLDRDRALSLPLKRDGVHEFQNYSGPKERCMELAEDIYFPNGSTSPNPLSKPELRNMIADIKETIGDIDEVRVIGHADPVPFKGNPEKNATLAMKRACAVASYLKTNADGNRYRIAVESRGAREPKTLCKDWPIKESIDECFASNRRVDIRIKFKESAATTPPDWYSEDKAPLITKENVVVPPRMERKTERMARKAGIDSFEENCTSSN